MKQSFKFSSWRCALWSLGGWALLGFGIYMYLTWRNPDIGAYFAIGLMIGLGALMGVFCAFCMFSDYPVYIINERGLIVRQTFKADYHYRINWCDIEDIRITRGKNKQLQLKFKDGSKQYFHEKGRRAYDKQKLKFSRTTEFLALAPMIEGGRRNLYRILCEYWEYYRHE